MQDFDGVLSATCKFWLWEIEVSQVFVAVDIEENAKSCKLSRNENDIMKWLIRGNQVALEKKVKTAYYGKKKPLFKDVFFISQFLQKYQKYGVKN